MKTQSKTSRWGGLGGAVALLATAAGTLPGCRGDREDKPPHQFLPDMDDSPKFKPQSESPFFADGRAMRHPVEGTVAFGRKDFDIDNTQAEWAAPYKIERNDLIKDDDAFYRGTTAMSGDGKPTYVKKIPIEVNEALIKRGQERYNIYCVVCHGYEGNGQGTVAQKWTGFTVANFHDPKYADPNEPDQKNTDGFVFHTALTGVPNPADTTPDHSNPKMPGYAHALTERDAWAIVAYVRVLQESIPLKDVPAARRSQLEADVAKLPPPPAPPPGATGATGATGASGATGATPKGNK